jgi:hypothetical protein
MASMDFFMRDLYPNYQGLETSTEAVLDASDKQVLTTQDGTDDNEVDHATNTKNSKSIIFAILLIIGVVIFLGSFTK